jgi:hypothetical protein
VFGKVWFVIEHFVLAKSGKRFVSYCSSINSVGVVFGYRVAEVNIARAGGCTFVGPSIVCLVASLRIRLVEGRL